MLKIITDADFAQIRKDRGCYVDKTWFIKEFLQNPAFPDDFSVSSKVTLFTRPRRFGKSLFINMLSEFFDNQKDSKDIFSGLQVSKNEKLCQEWMNKFPLIYLNFKDEEKENFDDAVESLWKIIRKICVRHKYLLTSERVEDDDKNTIKQYIEGSINKNTLQESLQVLTNAMTCHYRKKTVLLIDEYDTPLGTATKHKYYEKMINFMREFYSRALKDNNALGFGILTGILRVAKESIFSGLNNLECYDITEELYADLFGFTQKEVDSLLARAKLEDKRDAIKEWYDGYHFGDRTDIYNPWSIMQYLKTLQNHPQKAPKAYWVNTSDNELAQNLIRRFSKRKEIRTKIFELIRGNPIAVKLYPQMNYAGAQNKPNNFWTVLFLSGYLTIPDDRIKFRGVKKASDSILVIPNKEIQTVFNDELETWMENIISEDRITELCDALWSKNVKSFEKIADYLLVGHSVRDKKESSYHDIIYGLMRILYTGTISNGESGKGYFDVLVPDKDNSRAAVLEFKRAPSEGELEQYAHMALKQIEDREYDARIRAEGYETILHVGAAFCDKKAKVLFKDASV